MALRDQSSALEGNQNEPEEKISTLQRQWTEQDRTDAFFARLAPNKTIENMDPQAAVTSPLIPDEYRRQKPIEQSPESASAILGAIQALREDVRVELGILRSDVQSLRQAVNKDGKAISELQKPLWKKFLKIFSSGIGDERSKTPSPTYKYRPTIEELGDGIRMSVAPIPSLEGFLSPTATIRVLDEAQPSIVGVTRQGISNITNGFGATEMADNWAASSILNGQEQALPFNYRRDFSVETRNVTPKLSYVPWGNTAMKITWENMPAGYRANIGGFYDHTFGSTDGTVVLGLPWTMYDQGFTICLRQPNHTIITNNFYCQIRGGDFYNGAPSPFSQTFDNLSWTRTFQPDDLRFALVKNLAGFECPLPGGMVWKVNEVVIHPGSNEDAVLTWTSPATGTASIKALLQDKKVGLGDGVTYTIQRLTGNERAKTISTGIIGDGGSKEILEGSLKVAVRAGDKIRLIISAKGTTGDATNAKWDSISTSMEVKLTEAEKTYEKVTVAPSIQLRTIDEGRTLVLDYRHMPADVKLRIQRRGTEWNDGDWGKMEIVQSGSGVHVISFNSWLQNAAWFPVDIYLVDPASDGEPIEEVKLSFTVNSTNAADPYAGIPLEKKFIGSRAHDVLRDPLLEPTDADEEAVLAVVDYRKNLNEVPAARDWTNGQTFDARAQAESMGIYTGSYFAGGGQLVGNGGNYKVMYDLDSTKYQRHGVSSDGSAYIVRPWYMVKGAIKKLPETYWRRLPNGEILTTPNGPRQIIYEVSLNGRYTGGPEDNSTNMIDLMPIEGLHISGGIQQLKAELADPAYTGFRGLITEFREASSPVLLPGTAVQLICQFESIGTIGGQITVKTTCGYTGDPNVDPVQGLDTKVFAVNGKYSLVRNIHAPSNPPTQGARPIITVEVQYPDGRKEILGQRLAKVPTDRTFTRTDPATGRSISTYQDYTPEEMAHMQRVVARFEQRTGVRPTFIGDTSQGHAMTPNSYYERVAQELLRTNSENTRALAFGDQLLEIMERVNRDVFVDSFQQNHIEQYAGTTEAQTALKIEQAGTAIGFCKENTNNATVKTQLIGLFTEMFGIPQARAESQVNTLLQQQGGGLNDALAWFNSNEAIPEMEYFVRNDTAMSKVFLGMLQEAKTHTSDQDRIRIALTMQNITGIPVTKLLHVLQASDGVWSRIIGRMKNLFTTAQYGHIFVPKPGPEQEILMAQTNKDASHPYVSGEKIRIRFDLASSASDYDHILPYLWQNGMQVSDSPITNAETADKLFMELALSDVVKQSVASGMQIKLAAWVPVSPNQSGFRTISALSNVIAVPEHVELAFDPQEVVGAQWLTLNDAQKTTVRNALNFGEGIPEKNAQLINWLVNFIKNKETLSTQSSQLKWIGEAIQDDPNDDRDNNNLWGECKYWLQTNVLKDGLGISIEKNKTNKYAWEDSNSVERRTTEGEIGTNFESIVKNPELVQSGDMIQIFGGGFALQHTMTIGRIENDGIWVFDSNYVAKTPQYHKLLFSKFNSNQAQFTIYRLK